MLSDFSSLRPFCNLVLASSHMWSVDMTRLPVHQHVVTQCENRMVTRTYWMLRTSSTGTNVTQARPQRAPFLSHRKTSNKML